MPALWLLNISKKLQLNYRNLKLFLYLQVLSDKDGGYWRIKRALSVALPITNCKKGDSSKDADLLLVVSKVVAESLSV